MNRTANTQAQTQSPAHSRAGLKRSNGLPAFALAALMTLAMLGGIDHLATGSSAAGNSAGPGAASVQMAKAAAPHA
ncbi:MAG: hypothetical protein ABIN96_12055 [Rubrivivax sp.]